MFFGKNRHRRICILFIAFIGVNVTNAATPNSGDTNTFVGPYLHGSFTNDYNPGSAFSVGADMGVRNYRLNGTLAWEDTANQRMKISAEWLKQNIGFAFFSGNTTQWIDEAVIGGNYRYYFEGRYFDPVLTFDAYYQQGSSFTLRTTRGTYVNQSGVTTPYVNNQRIAGADAGGVAPGVILHLWPTGHVGATFNYDNVSYDTAYVGNKDAKGFGGTVNITQELSDDFNVRADLAFLQAYNNYGARINFADLAYYGEWLFAVEGNYTIGKNTMPNTYNIGLSVDYQLDRRNITSYSVKAAREAFLTWASQSAARKPQVLGIPDQRVL